MTRRTLVRAAAWLFAACRCAGAGAETRDPWLWPFAADSIWNVSIGSGARYVPAGIGQIKAVGVDEEYFFKLKASDPMRPLLGPGSFGPGRCTGTQSMGISLPVPDDLVIPDATRDPYSTPNNATAFLMPDGKTIVQVEPLARCVKGGPVYGYRYSHPKKGWTELDIYGEGAGGTHFGSGLSAIGGSIRKGELTGPGPIRHALKILFWGKQYFYNNGGKDLFRWPADRADAYAATTYAGKNPELRPGSLLALKPDLKPESIGIRTPVGRKLFAALQDYGAYVVDDSFWDATYFAAEHGVPAEVKAKTGLDMHGYGGAYFDDVMRLLKALHVVANNAESAKGGGGVRRRPPPPPFAGVSGGGTPAGSSGSKPTARFVAPAAGATVSKAGFSVKVAVGDDLSVTRLLVKAGPARTRALKVDRKSATASVRLTAAGAGPVSIRIQAIDGSGARSPVVTRTLNAK